MRIKKIIVSILAFSMVFGLENIKVYAISKPNISYSESITNTNKVFNPETVDRLWDELNDNLVIEPDKQSDFIRYSKSVMSVSSEPYGSYPTRKGVILVTADKWKGVVPLGHAAIVYSDQKVIEALQDGVVIGRNDWYKSKSTCFGVSVRSTTASQDAQAADYCYEQLNKEYNYNYYNMNTRKKFYCSHLVWAAYKDLFGIDLNTPEFDITLKVNDIPLATVTAIHPLELVNNDLTFVTYVK